MDSKETHHRYAWTLGVGTTAITIADAVIAKIPRPIFIEIQISSYSRNTSGIPCDGMLISNAKAIGISANKIPTIRGHMPEPLEQEYTEMPSCSTTLLWTLIDENETHIICRINWGKVSTTTTFIKSGKVTCRRMEGVFVLPFRRNNVHFNCPEIDVKISITVARTRAILSRPCSVPTNAGGATMLAMRHALEARMEPDKVTELSSMGCRSAHATWS
mmetsp:Transcript_20646/g.59183  ORF Transcript_20646/g.59183 Transcript_20646/m.59183 type:complete len:217 (+) Transcript_20646:1607-2257(+)